MDKILLIDPVDDVVTALEPVARGEALSVETQEGVVCFTALQDVGMGHKMAVRPLRPGQPVRKYGAAIGDATQSIAAGEHVHSHNLSGYRGRE